MKTPISAEKAEEIILYYIKIRYLALRGEISKIGYYLEIKARELGFARSAAWAIIKYARRIGMVEGRRFLRVT